MTENIRALLGISVYDTSFRGVEVKDPQYLHHLFHDTVCDQCDASGAVHVEFAVLDPEEGYVATDAMFCPLHASDGVRCILDREGLSQDHGVVASVNAWAIRYGAFAVRA